MACITANPPVSAPRSRLALWLHRFEEWNNRRALHKVLQLDPHLLHDIGLTHGDLERAMNERLNQDAGAQLMAQRNPHLQ